MGMYLARVLLLLLSNTVSFAALQGKLRVIFFAILAFFNNYSLLFLSATLTYRIFFWSICNAVVRGINCHVLLIIQFANKTIRYFPLFLIIKILFRSVNQQEQMNSSTVVNVGIYNFFCFCSFIYSFAFVQ